MAKRSITDNEIGLIKSMLGRDLKNNEIQFYFNRQDRPVNSGRITGIRDGTYGGEVPCADDVDLEAFLSTFKASEIGVQLDTLGVVKPMTLAEEARSYFEASQGRWKVACGEGADCESKSVFDLKEPVHLIRTIAAMANNRGGFMFFGIDNESQEVVGMLNQNFQNADISQIIAVIRNYLSPCPEIKKFELVFGSQTVGVIRVEQYDTPPVVIVKQHDKARLGDIIFRYSGRSEVIRPPELFELLRRRDLGSANALLSTLQQVAQIGPSRTIILDSDVNKIDAENKTILIDSKLAQQLKFIEEGSFDEKDGAPTLKLLGEVSQTETIRGETEVVVQEKALDPDMVVMAFLQNEEVSAPLEYLKESAMVQRRWLPLNYFVARLPGGLQEATSYLRALKPGYKPSQKHALQRISREKRAFNHAPARAQPALEWLQSGLPEQNQGEHCLKNLASAIQALPAGFRAISKAKKILVARWKDIGDDASLRSAVYRAACRLDELELDASNRK